MPQPPLAGRWFITDRACRELLALQRRALTEANVDDATEALARASLEARFVRAQRNGLELWRGRLERGGPRYRYLIGQPDTRAASPLPALVSVLGEHDRKDRR